MDNRGRGGMAMGGFLQEGAEMRVFITGGMGFIGSYIVMELLQRGHRVSILARNPAKVAAFIRNAKG